MRRNSRLDEVISTFESKGFISLLCEGKERINENGKKYRFDRIGFQW